MKYLWEPLKTGVKSKNGQGVPASRKSDEVRLYALRGGLTTKMVRTAHFRSHEVFRGDLMVFLGKMQYSLVFCCGSSQTAAFSQTQIPEKRKPIPVSREKCLLTLF